MQDNKTSSASNKSELDRELQHAFLKFVEDIEDGSFNITLPCGICHNFTMFLTNNDYPCYEESYKFLQRYFRLWDKFSGNVKYPVPGEGDAYENTKNLWDKSQEYGKLRWELLYFIRDYCYTQITNKGEVK